MLVPDTDMDPFDKENWLLDGQIYPSKISLLSQSLRGLFFEMTEGEQSRKEWWS